MGEQSAQHQLFGAGDVSRDVNNAVELIPFNAAAPVAGVNFDPQIHIGGDNVMFWGPLAWSIIFGLSFATFLTLIFVPSLYLITYEMKIRYGLLQSESHFKKSP